MTILLFPRQKHFPELSGANFLTFIAKKRRDQYKHSKDQERQRHHEHIFHLRPRIQKILEDQTDVIDRDQVVRCRRAPRRNIDIIDASVQASVTGSCAVCAWLASLQNREISTPRLENR